MSTYTSAVTREQAEEVLALVRSTFRAWLVGADGMDAEDDPNTTGGPTLHEPGHEEVNGWTIAWEEGPYCWTYTFPHGGRDEEFGIPVRDVSEKAPAGVFLEPVAGWCLGVYEA